MEKIWKKQKSIELIECYRKRTVLWDIKNEDYKESVKKFAAWAEIAKIFNTDIYEVRRKMQAILAAFRRERTKAYSTWFGLEHLTFLHDLTMIPRVSVYANAKLIFKW